MILELPCKHRVETVESVLSFTAKNGSIIIICDVCNQTVNYAIRPITGLSDIRIGRLSERLNIPIFRTRRVIHQDRRLNG